MGESIESFSTKAYITNYGVLFEFSTCIALVLHFLVFIFLYVRLGDERFTIGLYQTHPEFNLILGSS
jgi:hypothetical protein